MNFPRCQHRDFRLQRGENFLLNEGVKLVVNGIQNYMDLAFLKVQYTNVDIKRLLPVWQTWAVWLAEDTHSQTPTHLRYAKRTNRTENHRQSQLSKRLLRYCQNPVRVAITLGILVIWPGAHPIKLTRTPELLTPCFVFSRSSSLEA